MTWLESPWNYWRWLMVDGGWRRKATEWWSGIYDWGLGIGEWGLCMERRGEEKGVMGWDCMGCENVENRGKGGVQD
jgi:hypothetical protein